jgi:hypothetical protein
MTEVLNFLAKLSPHTTVLIITIVIVSALIKSKDIIDLVKWFSKKQTTRTCGDCILIMFGIREKYETASFKITQNVLRSQMSYFEQKSRELTTWLTQSFQDDIEELGHDKPSEMKSAQFGYYQEALKCAMLAVKDEIRKAFKENGFSEFSDNEFTSYTRSKLRTVTSIAKSYLNTYYIQNDDTIVPLKYRFEKLDMNKLNDLTFDVFGHAKDVVVEAHNNQKRLEQEFKDEIDSFIAKNKN